MRIKVIKLPDTYELFSYFLHHVGEERMREIWGYKHARTFKAWAAPPTAESSILDPLAKSLTMMEELAVRGHEQFVLDLLKRIVRRFGLELKVPYEPDKETIDEEVLDSTEALGHFITQLRKAQADGVIDEEEARNLVAWAEEIHRQTGELLSSAWEVLRKAERRMA